MEQAIVLLTVSILTFFVSTFQYYTFDGPTRRPPFTPVLQLCFAAVVKLLLFGLGN